MQPTYSMETLLQDIQELLRVKFHANLSETDRFFGSHRMMEARDLVYLITFIEDKFHVVFTPEDMDEDRFYTLQGLANILYEKITAE